MSCHQTDFSRIGVFVSQSINEAMERESAQRVDRPVDLRVARKVTVIDTLEFTCSAYLELSQRWLDWCVSNVR